MAGEGLTYLSCCLSSGRVAIKGQSVGLPDVCIRAERLPIECFLLRISVRNCLN